MAEHDDLEGIAWRWQSVDGAMIKAPLAQQAVGPNPTDRGKNGSKRHLLVDGHGVPLSLIVTGANRHDVSQLEAVLDAMMVRRPPPPPRRHKHLCVDAGYVLTRFSLGSLDAGMSDEASGPPPMVRRSRFSIAC